MKKIIMMLLGVVFATGAWADTTFWKFSTGDSYLKDGYGDGSVFSRLPSTPVYCLCAEDATDTSDVTAQNALLSDLREDMIDIANSAVAMAETDDNGRVRARDGIAFDLESESICSGATAYFYEVVLSFDGKYVYISDLVSATASSSEPTSFILSSEASTNRVDKTGTADFSKAGWYALAVPSLDPIEYLTWDEESKSLVAATNKTYEVVTADTATFEDGKWYVVNSTIERGAITVNGAAHLILCDGASLTVTGGARAAGIEVPAGKSLTIYGQASGTGALIANGSSHEAGIGGGDMCACGNITINGGTITANGVSGAGIGGGCEGAGGTVTINAGTITASSSYGAGIGAGQSSSAHGVITFAEGVEFSIVAGDDEASATEKTVTEYMVGRGAKYVKIAALAGPTQDPIEYFTWDAEAKSLVAATNTTYEVVTAETATFEDGKWYVVTNTIERGTITVNGAAHLILCDGASLTVTGAEYEAGIEVAEGQSLTIYGQSEGTGKLIANGGTSSTGIGGKDVGTCGTITINGGTIKATGGQYAAGIGGGSRTADTVTITINGGEIEANGGAQGAGIGAGNYYNYGGSRSGADTITINGGAIKATGGQYAAGIGGSSDGFAATVTINGGIIKATGGSYGAGIGSGDRVKGFVTIAINGGEIDAIGGHQGAGIGSGNYFQFNGSRSGTDVITINGGTIQATGGQYSAGIGGSAFGFDATVTINGGAITASTSNAEAIGRGYSAVSPTTVTFGEDAVYRIVTGDDPATAEIVLAADFAADHSATSVSCTAFDPIDITFPVVAGLKYTVVVDGEEYIGAISGETYTVAVPNGSTVTITYSPDNSTITLGTGITNPVTLTNITEAKAFTKADLPSVTQTTPISYLAWDDEKKELYTELSTNFIYEVVTEKTKNLNDGFWYVVNTDVERGAIKVNGSAHLILCDGASLKVTGGEYVAGVEVAEGCALTIYGQSEGTGKFEANGGRYGAGIGGNSKGTCGTITINGGTIAAISSGYGAGIGGSAWGSNGATITINGGNVEAIGGKQGAGIGSGNYYQFDGSRSGTDLITINGGTITATGGQWGAGIGSGSDGLAATVMINGGTITASTVPGQGAEAIGNGSDAVAATTVAFGEGAEISIKAGDDEASATATTVADYVADHSAVYVKIVITPPDPIEYLTWDEAAKSLVAATNKTYEVVTAETATFEDGKWYVVTNTIERGTIKVTGAAHLILCDGASLTVKGNSYDVGIEVPADKSLTIYGQSEGVGAGKLVAIGAEGAGIGAASDNTCGTITINGGTIDAKGGAYGAGIGGGKYCKSAAMITINGGTITATGNSYGAGIGGGNYSNFKGSRSGADLITINGGTITATGGSNSAGIGSGYAGLAATVTINGGIINATGGSYGAGIGSGRKGLAATVTINGGSIIASIKSGAAEAIGKGADAVDATTVTFGTALASRYVWAGASATTVELMTVADFATNHSAAYAELPVDCYTVEYNANNAAGTMSNSVFAVGKEVTLKKNAFTALGYTFKGWTTNGTDIVYADEATGTDFATTNATLTLTAKWELDSNGVTAEDFTSLTNMLATAKNQSTSLGVTIGFDSGVTIPAGETVTLPDVGTTGFEGLKYEDSTKMWLEDGVLYADKLRGNVTVDALQLMKLANGGTTPTSFKVITEGEGTSVTNDVIMLLGSDRQQYCNDEDNVAQMIDAVLAASPRPETVTLFDVKETIVSFTDFTDGKDGVYEVDEGETAKIAIAGGSMANAVEATLYCVSMSSGAIKTTGGKFARNLIYIDGKRVNFPITLKWEKGDAEPKIVEIVTVANKAVKPDRYVRLQLGAPVGCKIVAGSDYAQLTIKDGGPDPRREVTASIYPAHAGKVSGMGFLKNEKSVITLTAKPASFAKTSTFKGWFKAGEDGSIDCNAPVSTELKLKVGYEDAGRYVAYFEDVLALPQAVAPEVFKDGQIAQGVEGVAPMDKDNSMLMLLAGAKVSLPINFSEETTGVTGVTAKGLPNGLKVAFDKKTGTCVITGKPTAKIGHYTSTLTVKNAAGKSTTTINFVVYSLKGRAVGLGRAEGMPNSNIDMTIGSSGSVSAKINVAGVYNFSFSAKNLNYTCDSDLNPIITIDLTNSKLEQELKLTWNSEEAAFEGEFMGSKFTAILLDSGSKTVGTYTDKIFDSDTIQIGTMKVVVKESGLATITGKIDGNSFSTFGYAEEGDGKAYAYKTEFFTGTTKYYFFGDDVRLYDDCVYEILGHGGYQGGEISDEVSFSEPLLPPQ